jgi:hypothetical protein
MIVIRNRRYRIKRERVQRLDRVAVLSQVRTPYAGVREERRAKTFAYHGR